MAGLPPPDPRTNHATFDLSRINNGMSSTTNAANGPVVKNLLLKARPGLNVRERPGAAFRVIYRKRSADTGFTLARDFRPLRRRGVAALG